MQSMKSKDWKKFDPINKDEVIEGMQELVKRSVEANV